MLSNQLKMRISPRRGFVNIHETLKSKPKGNEIGEDDGATAYTMCVCTIKSGGKLWNITLTPFVLPLKQRWFARLSSHEAIKNFPEENELKWAEISVRQMTFPFSTLATTPLENIIIKWDMKNFRFSES